MTTTEKTAFAKALESYIDELQQHSDKDFKENYPNTWERGDAPQFKYMPGDKFIRITTSSPGCDNASVFCFVDLSNGDIYKPAGWNGRAKGSRGNIFNEKRPLTGGALYR